ncbi:MoaD/ThiS family protein [Novosphingobium sp. 9]|uniref:MoaD/ThiS family protein n=1 Tax=Novosphingobium sp. 9 TaxID=2025349 RepID=UPI0021B57C2F|nr:MoaD/ThiS family protein [Novosphingobium sp. 9]
MALKLVFLGRLEDVAGAGEREAAFVPDLAALRAALPSALAEALAGPRVRVAVNGVLLADDATVALNDGDEIAFLPPVSGG